MLGENPFDVKFKTSERKHLPTSDRSRNNARLTKDVPRRKSAHSTNWLILLARFYNYNKNIVNIAGMEKRNVNQLA